MSETVDKVTDKLLASIQKSQNTPPSNDTESSDTTSSETPQKPKTRRTPAAKKAIEEVATSSSIESPRKFIGNLRWPD